MYRAAQNGDISHIAANLWDRGKLELNAYRVGVIEFYADFLGMIADGNAIIFGDPPAAYIGCKFVSPGVIKTFFQATKDFEKPGIGKAVTKDLRAAIPLLCKERGAHTSLTYSLCVDESAPKWFRLLGLTEDESYRGPKYGPYRERLFVRRFGG